MKKLRKRKDFKISKIFQNQFEIVEEPRSTVVPSHWYQYHESVRYGPTVPPGTSTNTVPIEYSKSPISSRSFENLKISDFIISKSITL